LRAWPRGALTVGLAAAAAALVAFVIVPGVVWRSNIEPVRAAMAASSSRGLLYPNVRPSGSEGTDVYRSAVQPGKAGLPGAIHRLSERYERDPGSWRTAYWLVAARMEADQLPQARSILDGALRRSPQQRWLRLLDGMLACREGRLEASAAIFDSLVQTGSGDPLAADNLARVRAELGDSARGPTRGSD
jgi:predicted Zn-dependent protease